VRKLLALLLLAILPLTPSWAGVAVDCPGGASVAAVAQVPAPGDAAAVPDCCGDAGGETHEVQCGSDGTECHCPGLMALTGLPASVGPVATGTGDSTHAYRIAAPVTSAPLRPPSGAHA